MSTKGDSVVLTIKLRPDKKAVNTVNKVTGSEDIMRMTLGSATIRQLDGGDRRNTLSAMIPHFSKIQGMR